MNQSAKSLMWALNDTVIKNDIVSTSITSGELWLRTTTKHSVSRARVEYIVECEGKIFYIGLSFSEAIDEYVKQGGNTMLTPSPQD